MFIATRSNTHKLLAGCTRGMLASFFMVPCFLMVLTAHQADLKSSESIEFVVEKIALLFNSRATMHVISALYHKTLFAPELFFGLWQVKLNEFAAAFLKPQTIYDIIVTHLAVKASKYYVISVCMCVCIYIDTNIYTGIYAYILYTHTTQQFLLVLESDWLITFSSSAIL